MSDLRSAESNPVEKCLGSSWLCKQKSRSRYKLQAMPNIQAHACNLKLFLALKYQNQCGERKIWMSLTHLAQQWSPLRSSRFWDRNPYEKQNRAPPAWYQPQNRRSQWNKARSSPNGPNDKEKDQMIKQNNWKRI